MKCQILYIYFNLSSAEFAPTVEKIKWRFKMLHSKEDSDEKIFDCLYTQQTHCIVKMSFRHYEVAATSKRRKTFARYFAFFIMSFHCKTQKRKF